MYYDINIVNVGVCVCVKRLHELHKQLFNDHQPPRGCLAKCLVVTVSCFVRRT